MVYKEPREDGPANVMTWEKLDESGIEMSHETVVHPLADENDLSAVHVNMDSVSVEITEYISDSFSNAYAQFLLSFDTQELMSALEARGPAHAPAKFALGNLRENRTTGGKVRPNGHGVPPTRAHMGARFYG